MASASRSISSVSHARLSEGVIARISDRGPVRVDRVERARAVALENRLAAARFDLDAGDPRWQLASLTASRLQGTALPADGRDQLLKLAHHLGLRPFEANMIIAIVQDEARLESSGGQARRWRDRLIARLQIIPRRDIAESGHGAYARCDQSAAANRAGLPVGVQIACSLGLAAAIFTAVVWWLG